MRCLLLFLAFPLLGGAVLGQDRSVKKVLIVGIDGCRTDALLEANAPHLHRLIKDGAFSRKNDILGERKSGTDTVSAAGWTTILTGVWGDKHRVWNNSFFNGKSRNAPFFTLMRMEHPKLTTVALTSWEPMTSLIFGPGEGARLPIDGNVEGFFRGDERVTDAAVKVLKEDNSHALFVHFKQVDIAGHMDGFRPKPGKYLQAIARVDGYIGDLEKAIQARRTYAQEDWLTIVCTDHGGRGMSHRGCHAYDEVRYTFLIFHGPSVKKGPIEELTGNVDVAVTALTHLGIPILPAWDLDGRCVGLKTLP